MKLYNQRIWYYYKYVRLLLKPKKYFAQLSLHSKLLTYPSSEICNSKSGLSVSCSHEFLQLGLFLYEFSCVCMPRNDYFDKIYVIYTKHSVYMDFIFCQKIPYIYIYGGGQSGRKPQFPFYCISIIYHQKRLIRLPVIILIKS